MSPEDIAPSVPPQPAPAGPSEADYEIIRPIGRGAYGEVYLARNAAGTYRAVKVIFRESFERDRPFEREFEGIRRFMRVSQSYDNQVQIFHLGRREAPSQFYYIMELADDEVNRCNINPETYVPRTLRSELKRRGRLPVKECLSIGTALTQALESLHENGLVHRDVKPGNIIFVKDRPKLADIGLVSDTAVTMSCVGTEGFIAPEGPGSPQADLYGLGKVLYELCTGKDRLDFPDLPADFTRLPDRELLLELNTIIARACERDPRKRYPTAREMREDLHRLQRGGSVRARRAVRRNVARAGVCALILALSGALGFGVYRLARSRTSGSREPSVTDSQLWHPSVAANPMRESGAAPNLTPESGATGEQAPPAVSSAAEASPVNALTGAEQAAGPLPNILTPQEKAAGWRLLFDGQTLNGWRSYRQPKPGPEWQVSNGAIVLERNSRAGEGGRMGAGLMTEKQFGDFSLAIEYRIVVGANSGILYRVTEAGREANETGPEMQVLDNQRHPDGKRGADCQAGACYAIYAPAKDATRPVGEWNQAQILVRKNHVEHWLNGQRLLAYELGSEDWQRRVAHTRFNGYPGYGRASQGYILLQDHGFHIEFRNIKLRPLGAGQ